MDSLVRRQIAFMEKLVGARSVDGQLNTGGG
jgi:hypothetical protein